MTAGCSSDSDAASDADIPRHPVDDHDQHRSADIFEGLRKEPAPLPAGVSDHTLSDGSDERPYQLIVSEDFDATKPHAVVLGLHALTVPHTFIPSMSGIDTMVDEYDFIGVTPSGRLNGPTPFWNAAPTADNYDVDFLGRLLDDLEATYCVDPSRILSLGMSNGAQMSSLLACRLHNRIRAIGPIAGEEYPRPCDTSPVPIMAFHGTADPIVTYDGGGLNSTRIADLNYWHGDVPDGLPAPLGIDASMARWAEHNGCAPELEETRLTDEVRRRTWTGCAAPTILYIIEGGGHAWPGKPVPAFEAQFGPGTTDIDASDLLFDFFFHVAERER